MGLFESISQVKAIRGIALNSQEIDLFNIIEQAGSREEAIIKVNEYLDGILQANILSKEMESQRLSTEQKIKKVLDEKTNDDGINKDDFYKFLLENTMQIAKNWDSKEKLQDLFKDKQIDDSYIDEILNIKKYFAYQTHGILTFLVDKDGNTINPENEEIEIDKNKTYQKVQALHDFVIGSLSNEENRFNRLTLDGQGKFGTVAGVMQTEREGTAKPKDYNLESLKQGYEFAKRNGMKEVYINALVFFKDFPDRLVGANSEQYKTALTNYGKAIASVANEYENNGIDTAIDMFNEFVDYNEPFSERTNNWMSKLSVEDLCEVALELKKEMPNVDFGYNDWNFENPDKRKAIFEVIRKIQNFEKQNDCKIVDHIGTQCHTSINDIDGLKKSIEELEQFGLPIDITELDISKGLDGVDYKEATKEELSAIRKYEQKLQNDVMKLLTDFVKDGKIRAITAWSITDELCCDFCDGKEASVNSMTYDKENGFTFSEKDMDKQIEMTAEEMFLIKNHKDRVKEIRSQEINQNPIQDFCFHTHTQRCGHGAKDTGDEEWVQHAIKEGIKILAFTDHVPLPDGLNNKAKSRMDIAEVPTYLKSIEYLKDKYKGQIDIESGFEFEYSDRDLEHLQTLKSKTDKMILGQHFVIDDSGIEYDIQRGKGGRPISDEVLDMYSASITSAMQQGIPDIIAHPDLFMKARDNFGVKEQQITREICEKAIEYGIPLEINFGEIAKGEKASYPCKEFWELVGKEYGDKIKVVFGKDAHYPDQLFDKENPNKDYKNMISILGVDVIKNLQFVKGDLQTKDTEIVKRLEEYQVKPTHIVTKKEMLESSIKENISIEEVESAGILLEEPEKSKETTITQEL